MVVPDIIEAISGFRNLKSPMSRLPSSGPNALFLVSHWDSKKLLESNLKKFTQRCAKVLAFGVFFRMKFSFPKLSQK